MDFLVVDDDDVFRHRLTTLLAKRGFEAKAAGSQNEAVRLHSSNPAKKIILDLKIPGVQGLELLDRLIAISAQTEIVVLTGYGSIPTAVEATRKGAKNFLIKPLDLDSILEGFSDNSISLELTEIPIPSLGEVEWEHIQRVLRQNDGNITVAARQLGMHRRSLQRRLARGAIGQSPDLE